MYIDEIIQSLLHRYRR